MNDRLASAMTTEAQPAPGAPALPELDLAALRAQFRDGKRALIEHFMQGRATAPAATRLIKACLLYTSPSPRD